MIYARVRAGRKLHRESLETSNVEVAKEKLVGVEKRIRAQAGVTEDGRPVENLTWGQCAAIRLAEIDGNPQLKPRTKAYYHEIFDLIEKTWPKLKDELVGKVKEQEVERWATRLRNEGTTFVMPNTKGHIRRGMSPARYNCTIDQMRNVFAIAIRQRLVLVNPVTEEIPKLKARKKHLNLPTTEQFRQFWTAIRQAGARQSLDCSFLVRFLALTGCRISEANRVQWQDIKDVEGMVLIRGDWKTGTKNWSWRSVPLHPDLKALIDEIRAEYPDARPTGLLLKVKTAKKSMNSAAKAVGIARMSHHNLRDYLITHALQCGVDVATIAQWVGHKDGGALILRTYTHILSEHSKKAADKLKLT